jgi:hypothetical protein
MERHGKKIFAMSENICIFATDLVAEGDYPRGVKRESGENPEQSRCCELIRTAAPNKKPLCDAIVAWEGRAAESESEDLPSR